MFTTIVCMFCILYLIRCRFYKLDSKPKHFIVKLKVSIPFWWHFISVLILLFVNDKNVNCLGDARDSQVWNPGQLLHEPSGVPDRFHGRLHAVHQYSRTLSGGMYIYNKAGVYVLLYLPPPHLIFSPIKQGIGDK